ncbi:MAG: ABC transporter ATP-binding protein [Phaeodactylibacter sp.]|uniref:sulfate/molybdate ABC transporter ATP-binding protein n=1 Tax=Phaeodactylibacter sp. TaxID=1940289 RepID=UPI0032EC3CDB
MIQILLRKSLHAATGPMTLEVQLDILTGEFLAVTGASGSGKTTLLRLLAGLEQPEDGHIIVDNNVWLDQAKGIQLPIQQREVGLVFQEYALFPNMTVRQNLEYGLRKGQSKAIVDELIGITELDQLLDRYPAKLSGGQQQRVALARALVRRPKLLLLDEPLSALDSRMRARLQNYILQAHQALELTTLLVSHDYREIFKLADRVIALKQGRISQPDLPETVQYANASDGAFRLSGEVLHLEEAGSGFSVSVLIGTNVLRVLVTMESLRQLQPGDRVEVLFDAQRTMLTKA